MKYIIALLLFLTWPLAAQVTVNVEVTLSAKQVWALQKDYLLYSASDTNAPPITQIQWFRMMSTNSILKAADRRVDIWSQEMRNIIGTNWSRLTPEQMTNVIQALPPQP